MKETGQHEDSCWQTSLALKRIVQMIWEGILPDARCTRSDAVRSRLRPGVTVPGALLLCTQPSLGCSAGTSWDCAANIFFYTKQDCKQHVRTLIFSFL